MQTPYMFTFEDTHKLMHTGSLTSCILKLLHKIFTLIEKNQGMCLIFSWFWLSLKLRSSLLILFDKLLRASSWPLWSWKGKQNIHPYLCCNKGYPLFSWITWHPTIVRMKANKISIHASFTTRDMFYGHELHYTLSRGWACHVKRTFQSIVGHTNEMKT